MPHNYAIALDIDGKDVWVGTAKGLALGNRRRLLPWTQEDRGEVRLGVRS